MRGDKGIIQMDSKFDVQTGETTGIDCLPKCWQTLL
uniref:Uncharacterized protein n=1 Tax=Setaria italica TaxID=4555 RepID=K4AP07_SETIT